MDETRAPLSQYSPSFGVSRQPMTFIRVDLPDPDGPMIATYSLRAIARSTPRSARTISPPMSYSRLTPRVRITQRGSGVDPAGPTSALRPVTAVLFEGAVTCPSKRLTFWLRRRGRSWSLAWPELRG